MPGSVEVRLDARSYRVLIGSGILDSAAGQIAELKIGSRCAVITDSNVTELFAERLKKNLDHANIRAELIVVPAGEKSKSFSQIEEVCDAMIAAGLDRSAFVIALGGGVIGDLA